MQIRTILLSASVLGLAACGGGGGDYERSQAAPAPMMAEEAIVVEADMGFNAKSSGPARPRDETPDSVAGEPAAEQYIAYSHSLGMRPAERRRSPNDEVAYGKPAAPPAPRRAL